MNDENPETVFRLAPDNRRNRAAFIDFVYELYAGNRNYKDSLISVLKTFLYQRDSFSRACFTRLLVVQENGLTQAQALAIHHPALDILQLGFFEARPRQAAVAFLVQAARDLARQRNVQKLLFGLNGHVSYGVGFLLGPYDQPNSFDSQYTLSYYPQFFRQLGFQEKTLSTYQGNIDKLDLSGRGPERTREGIHYRTMNTKHFAREAGLFGELCDRCLANTAYYFPRGAQAMVELLSELKPLLKPEHLIFALDGAREVGFTFWQPDFNQILPGGQRNSVLKILWHYWRRHKQIDQVKLNAMGVLPEYLSAGLGLGLISQMYRYCHGRYRRAETNFVWDSNIESTRMNRAISDGVQCRYAVYESDLS